MPTGDLVRAGWTAALVAAETSLLAGLLLLAAFALWDSVSSAALPGSLWPEAVVRRLPAFESSELALAVVLIIGLYWLMQASGRSRSAFWMVSPLAMLPHTPAIWDHNQLEWYRFFGVEASFGEGQSLFWTASMFVLCLVGLMLLHRVIGLRKLDQLLASRLIDPPERQRTIRNEAVMLVGMIVICLLLTLLAVRAGSTFGESVSALARVPWTVLTVGGGATALLAGFVVLWFRGRANLGAIPPPEG